jgi:hypothetical protein
MTPEPLSIVVAYRGIPQARNWALGACLARAFKRLGHTVYEYGNYYQTQDRVSPISLPSSTDILVYCECNDLDPQYLELKSLKARWKVYWDFDVAARPASTFSFLHKMGFTHIFYGNKLYREFFLSLSPHVYYLPIGVDEELYHPLPDNAPAIDIGLCGTPYPSRTALINRLVEAGMEARLVTGVYAEDYVAAVNNFKIHLNADVGGGRGLLPSRIWETLGCKTLLLAERADFIELFFEEGQEVVLYSTPEECLEKARYYLTHQAEREQIAEQGYKKVLLAHTYQKRAQSIIEAVTSRQKPVWDTENAAVTWRVKMTVALLIVSELLRCQLPVSVQRSQIVRNLVVLLKRLQKKS